MSRPGAIVALWLPPVLYLAAIFWISSESSPFIALPPWPHSDKVAHGLAYAGLGALLCRAYRGSGIGDGAALALAALTAALYGASDEWHQSFVPHRSADPLDWLSDATGAVVGAALWVRLRALRGRRPQASIR